MNLSQEQIDVLNTLTPIQVKTLHALIEDMEQSEEFEADIPISDLFENAFMPVFIR